MQAGSGENLVTDPVFAYDKNSPSRNILKIPFWSKEAIRLAIWPSSYFRVGVFTLKVTLVRLLFSLAVTSEPILCVTYPLSIDAMAQLCG
jgi:hypothetical protein